MKLIIDIPEKIEEYIKDYIPIGAGDNVFCYPDEIVRMIQNGTPIPDNATNGDVITEYSSVGTLARHADMIHEISNIHGLIGLARQKVRTRQNETFYIRPTK